MNYTTKSKLDALQGHIRKEFKNWHKKYPNITGAYPGEKMKSGKGTGRYSIVFVVSRKLKKPAAEIPATMRVNIPGFGKKTIPTDIVEKEKFQFRNANLADNIKRTSFSSSGSTGLFLIKGQAIFACTNSHVILPDMIAAGRTHFLRTTGSSQPDVRLSNRNGERFDAYLQEGFYDGIDAAIARMDEPDDVGNRLPGFGRPAGVKEILQSHRGLKVTMIGGVSGRQTGTIEQVGVSQPTDIPDVFLHDLIEVNLFSQRGDSGSPVFVDPLRMIGIVVGGRGDTTTYIVPIVRILDKFKCDLLK